MPATLPGHQTFTWVSQGMPHFFLSCRQQGVRCQRWLGSSIPQVHVPRLALWTLGKELFCLI